jgi:hypothetical protein
MHAKAMGKHVVVVRWDFVEVVRHHALHADVELAVHIRLSPRDGPMRYRSVGVNGSADGEAHGGGAARACCAESIVTASSSSSGLKNSHYSLVNAEWSMAFAGGESRCSRSGLLKMSHALTRFSE